MSLSPQTHLETAQPRDIMFAGRGYSPATAATARQLLTEQLVTFDVSDPADLYPEIDASKDANRIVEPQEEY